MNERDTVLYEFHVARSARDRYQFDETMFSFNGNVVFANFHAARLFAQKMNQKRDLVHYPEQAIRVGQINAMGLIDEISHIVFRTYRQQTNPQMLKEALAYLDAQLGPDVVDASLRTFSSEFPPVAVYQQKQDLDSYLAGATGDVTHREVALEEMLMLWLANVNPAFMTYAELFDDSAVEQQTRYRRTISTLYEFLATQPAPMGGAGGFRNIVDLLRAPAIASPHSLEGQLSYILERWSVLVGSEFLSRLLSSVDVLKEETRPFLAGQGAGPGIGTGLTADQISVDVTGGLDPEVERFTADRDWMPRLVLLARNAFVWLDQLSKQYQRPITTLDQIPDEELDELRRRGVTGLWLIGLWERSAASKRIKQIMGNPDAVASAYSLYDYVIAYDLGGQSALENLRDRAWQRGIRMASDMVPNHVGIDGRWVIDHPDWFISAPVPPFPSYTFNGTDLSSDERVGLFLEDHYYNRTDAAVVFKRYDRWSGDERYIYHGNDGTSMPWNDTAQLNYLNPEAREAVIQTILHVARNFPIIRFDAAMTLAKRHYQRLWFPEPGTGNDIASRAEYGMTKAQFDALMPQEFWREVVDRCAVEAPDTLLLAEAFWLMESYFVRTLGMHRVYNSAFMVLLRDEDNAKYRQLMKNTLEFDAEILKRWVNFMNNPDEKTAAEQFGKGDKYFGVCTLMLTLPGLPMLGHGQVEGYTEKYGMEYRRAYYDERPEQWLIDRHAREIFPLAHKRYLFSGVENFLLYDFFSTDGGVDENVFAYSNSFGDERGLIVYHNRFATARGWVRMSAAFAVKTGNGDEKVLVQRSLGEGLKLSTDARHYVLFRDQTSGLEFIRSSLEIHQHGLYVELEAYKYQVFLDFREVYDLDGRYASAAAYLNGRGVPSVDEVIREIVLQPLHAPFREVYNAALIREMQAEATSSASSEPGTLPDYLAAFSQKLETFLLQAAEFDGTTPDAQTLADVQRRLEVLCQLESAYRAQPLPAEPEDTAPSVLPPSPTSVKALADYIRSSVTEDSETWGIALGWLLTHRLGALLGAPDAVERSRSLLDEWYLNRIIRTVLGELDAAEQADDDVNLLRILISQQEWYQNTSSAPAYQLVSNLLSDDAARYYLRINRYQGVLYYQKESFERLLRWLMLITVIGIRSDDTLSEPAAAAAVSTSYGLICQLQAAEAQANYQVDRLLDKLKA